jgi:Protein of unknown function (DUF998)
MYRKRALDGVLHGIAGVGPLLFLVVATTEGWLRADYDPIAQPISALALGQRGWVQELNFAVLAASFFSFAVVSRSQLRPGAASISAPALFVLMAMGVALAGAFPMDVPGAPATVTGEAHTFSGFLVFPWMPVVLLLVARRFRRDARWRRYYAYTLATGVLCLVTMIFFILFVGPPDTQRRYSDLRGLVQRLELGPFLFWVALVTRRAHRNLDVSRTSADRSSVQEVPLEEQVATTAR